MKVNVDLGQIVKQMAVLTEEIKALRAAVEDAGGKFAVVAEKVAVIEAKPAPVKATRSAK